MVSPTSALPLPLVSPSVASFARISDGTGWVVGTSWSTGRPVNGSPPGVVPLGVAVLWTTPPSTSAWVTV